MKMFFHHVYKGNQFLRRSVYFTGRKVRPKWGLLIKEIISPWETNKTYNRFLMQTEKSQPEAKLIMLKTRFIEFPALSTDPRAGISRSPSKIDD